MIRYVQIQTTSRCNADCVFCPQRQSWHAAHPGEMNDRLFAKILRDLQPWRSSIEDGKVCPYLMNEPLCDPRIFDRIAAIYEAFPRTRLEISTNAVLLDDARGERLIDALEGHRHEVIISHHGITPEGLEHVMKLPWDRVHNNTLRFLRQAAGRLRVRILGCGHSKDRRVYYFDSDDWRRFWKRRLWEVYVDPNHVGLSFAPFINRADQVLGDDRERPSIRRGKLREIGPGYPHDCWRLHEWIHVLWDGTLRLCCMDYHGQVELPNLRDVSIQDYLLGDRHRLVADWVTGRRTTGEKFLCKHCVQW